MRKSLKVGLLVLVTVFVAVCVLGVVLYQRQQRMFRESPFFQELTSLVQRHDFGAVTARLLEKARTADKSESRLVVVWLKDHAVDGNFPALYFTSLFNSTQGRQKEAAKWYCAAALVARVDAARCNDPTAGGAPRVIEGLFSDTKSHLTAHPEERKAAANWALEYEEKNKERPVARWISQHGMKAFTGGAKPLPDAEWQAARSRIRAEFEKSVAAN